MIISVFHVLYNIILCLVGTCPYNNIMSLIKTITNR